VNEARQKGRDVREGVDVPANDDGQLAFLGDAVLSLAVADALIREPGGKGAMTVERARQVRNRRLADLASALELPLELGEGERGNDAGKTARMAGGLESVIGAIHLDAGPAHAIAVVKALLARFGVRGD
jgi:dsRNA-specific ribonuclease